MKRKYSRVSIVILTYIIILTLCSCYLIVAYKDNPTADDTPNESEKIGDIKALNEITLNESGKSISSLNEKYIEKISTKGKI